MATRPRIDLDGVSLNAKGGPPMTLASFRHRTTDGIVLALPESADVRVAWDDVAEAVLDLRAGTLTLRFTASFAQGQNWLRGATTVVGQWTDRFVMGG
jgi:hypothetical protein